MKKNERLEKIPTKTTAISFEFDKYSLLDNNLLEQMNKQFEIMFKNTYEKQLNDMKNYIEVNRKLPKAQWYSINEMRDK